MHLPPLLANLLLLLQTSAFLSFLDFAYATTPQLHHQNDKLPTTELPKPILPLRHQRMIDDPDDSEANRNPRTRRPTLMDIALQVSAREGLNAMNDLYSRIEPEIVRNGQLLQDNHPAALLSKFSAPVEGSKQKELAAYATLSATKAFRKNYKFINDLARQAHTQKISLRRTALEGLCPPRDPPPCMPASERYRTHDGTCNNKRRLRWGASQMPFNRFLPPEYGDGVDTIRNSAEGGALSSSRFVSLLVHGARDGEAQLTLMTAQWGQLLDHDMTSTAQPRSINGSVPSCCGGKDFHPSCFPIKVPLDDPWLAPLKVRCLEFLRSAPAQRRDCVLSWREQTNQATSYIDASPIYSNSAKSSDNARVFRNGLLVFGRGNPAEDVCQRGAISTQCIRAGDGRSGEQPGLLALHHVWVGEHNRIATELGEMNLHWSDEKIFQETRRIVGAMFQHITYREFLPIVLGREVCKLFDLDLLSSGYYEEYDPKINPTVANSFAAAAFRFGHSLVQNSYMRCDRNHNIISNNVSLHEEFQRGDIGSVGSLHRLLRGMATQRALKRDEFITPELTNHLFQTPGFPFGLDLAAINIQRGRDHGIAPYTSWRIPCGLTPINSWDDFANVVGPESAQRISHAYRSVHDIDLFVGGIAERPVVGGLVGPTFACIIAQQFSNSRKGDRFWYENGGLENSFTPAQLHSLRRVSLAQVLCRAVGGGTFQQHIFIPAEFPGNERLPCGVGPLEPIDLSPWIEQDPFIAPSPQPTIEQQNPDRVFDILPIDSNTLGHTSIHILKEDKSDDAIRQKPLKTASAISNHVPHIDFIPNASTGFQRPTNSSKVSDKLDIRRKTSTSRKPTQQPITGVNNKLDKGSRITLNIKGVNRRRPLTPTRRKVIVNNIAIELRNSPETVNKKTDKNNITKTKTHSKLKKQHKPLFRADNVGRNAERNTDAIHTTTETATTTVPHLDELDLDSTTVADENAVDVFTTLMEKKTVMTPDPTETPSFSDDNFDVFTTPTQKETETTTEPTELPIIFQSQLTLTQGTANDKLEGFEDSPTETEDLISIHDSDILTLGQPVDSEPPRAQRKSEKTEDLITFHDILPPVQAADSEEIRENRNSEKTEDLVTFHDSDILTLVQPEDNEPPRAQRKLSSKTNSTTQLPTKNKTLTKISTNLTSTAKTSHGLTKNSPKLTTSTPKINKHSTAKTSTTTRIPKTTQNLQRSVESKQNQLQPIYTRPHKVILNGPNSDQYEIEINIRQTNKNPVPSRPNSNNPDFTTVYQPYDNDRYSSSYPDYITSTHKPNYLYYQHRPTTSPTYLNAQSTRPPTVIYLNEHDDRTTTKQPGFLQNIFTFASSTFTNHGIPFSQVTTTTEKYGPSSFESFGFQSNNGISGPNNPQLTSGHFAPGLSQTQSQLPALSSSFSQMGAVGVVHASSSGQFGSIDGVAASNGADSTFSFNIRPRPRPELSQNIFPAAPGTAPSVAVGGNYGFYVPPSQRPHYAPISRPHYTATPQSDQFYGTTHREEINSPFSTSHKRPRPPGYFSRTHSTNHRKEATKTGAPLAPAVHDYDYQSKTLEQLTNDTSTELDDDDYYDYENDDKNDKNNKDDKESLGEKFNKDGYLRPEHMATLLKTNNSNTTTNTDSASATKLNTTINDNFVLPLLNTTHLLSTELPIPMNMSNTTKTAGNVTNFPDTIARHTNNNILADDYEDDSTEPLLVSKKQILSTLTNTTVLRPLEQHTASFKAFAPIKVLTNPERPDNWIVYNTPVEKPMLEATPELKDDASLPAVEVPKPIKDTTNMWNKKHRPTNMNRPDLQTKPEPRTETDENGSLELKDTTVTTENIDDNNMNTTALFSESTTPEPSLSST